MKEKKKICETRGTSSIRNSARLGTYSRTMPRAVWWALGGGAVFCERGTPCGRLIGNWGSCYGAI